MVGIGILLLLADSHDHLSLFPPSHPSGIFLCHFLPVSALHSCLCLYHSQYFSVLYFTIWLCSHLFFPLLLVVVVFVVVMKWRGSIYIYRPKQAVRGLLVSHNRILHSQGRRPCPKLPLLEPLPKVWVAGESGSKMDEQRTASMVLRPFRWRAADFLKSKCLLGEGRLSRRVVR